MKRKSMGRREKKEEEGSNEIRYFLSMLREREREKGGADNAKDGGKVDLTKITRHSEPNNAT